MSIVTSLVGDEPETDRRIGTSSSTTNKLVPPLSPESSGPRHHRQFADEVWCASAFSSILSSSVFVDATHVFSPVDFGGRTSFESSTTPEVRMLDHKLAAQLPLPLERSHPIETDWYESEWSRLFSRAASSQAIEEVVGMVAGQPRIELPWVTSWRLQSPRAPKSKSTQVRATNVFLDEARRATTPRSAYGAFERLLRRVAAGERSLLDAMVGYLGDPRAPFKDTLLSCVADREMVLTHEPALRRLTALLQAADLEVARSAALALGAGGDVSCQALRAALAGMSDARREELERFLSFASDL